jgi:hypothetical protein
MWAQSRNGEVRDEHLPAVNNFGLIQDAGLWPSGRGGTPIRHC